MEISPDEFYGMINNDIECDASEMIELVDTYLCTTTEVVIEAVHHKTMKCTDARVCQRVCSSLLQQLDTIRDTDFISDLGKTYLNTIEAHLESHAS